MSSVFLIFGGTGRTGRHFVSLALEKGHKLRVVLRDTGKLPIQHAMLEVHEGSLADDLPLDDLLFGVDCVVAMLGDAKLQRESKVNTGFVEKLVPAMRRQGVKQFLYQAGGLTRPYKQKLPFSSWLLRNTLARFNGLIGQHKDNEAVIEYLVEKAQDIRWVVHRASLFSDAPSKGVLVRSETRLSVATFIDCAAYNYRLIFDESAIHTCDLSYYTKKNKR